MKLVGKLKDGTPAFVEVEGPEAMTERYLADLERSGVDTKSLKVEGEDPVAPDQPQSFRERVIVEKAELDDKIAKLGAFLGGPIYQGLDPTEQHRLEHQHDVMVEYSDILGERIAAWSGRPKRDIYERVIQRKSR